MSLLRVAELQLHQEIEDEGLRESMRQYAENTRNLQAQIDELQNRLLIQELTGGNNNENLGYSFDTVDPLVLVIALG